MAGSGPADDRGPGLAIRHSPRVQPGEKTGYRWAVLIVGTFAVGSYSLVRLGMPALAPEFRDEFALGLASVGMLLGGIQLGQLFTTYAWGWLADMRGERLVLALGLCGSAIAIAAASLASEAWQLLAALMVTGALGTAAVSASGRAVMGWFARGERGMALGIRQMAVVVGGGVGVLTLPWIAALGSLQATFLAMSGVLLAGGIASVLWVREAPADPLVHAREPGRSPLRDKRMWQLASAAACMLAAQASVYAFTVLFLHDSYGVSVAVGAACLAVIQLGGGVARVWVGRWSDRIGSRVPLMRRIAVLGAVLLGATALVAEMGSAALVLAALLPAGIVATSWNGLSSTIAVEIAGRARSGAAIGFQTTAFSFGSGLMPPLFGLIVDLTGWSIGFTLLAGLQLLAAQRFRPLVDVERRTIEREARETDLAARVAELDA